MKLAHFNEVDKILSNWNVFTKFFFSNWVVLYSVVKWKIYSHQKNISSNQLFSKFFSKNVAFTKFVPKKCESKFSFLPHCTATLWSLRNFCITWELFREINFIINYLLKKLFSRKCFKKSWYKNFVNSTVCCINPFLEFFRAKKGKLQNTQFYTFFRQTNPKDICITQFHEFFHEGTSSFPWNQIIQSGTCVQDNDFDVNWWNFVV